MNDLSTELTVEEKCVRSCGHYRLDANDQNCMGFCGAYASTYSYTGIDDGSQCRCDQLYYYGYHNYYDSSTINVAAGFPACGPCGEGRFRDFSTPVCADCTQDNYNQLCPMCPEGKYSMIPGIELLGPNYNQPLQNVERICHYCRSDMTSKDDRTGCICPEGTALQGGCYKCILNSDGSTTCTNNCNVYTWEYFYKRWALNPSIRSRCEPCPANFVPNADRTACVVNCPENSDAFGTECFCRPGSAGVNSCLLCPVGTYTDAHGFSSCNLCPAGKTTSGPGTTSQGDCHEPLPPTTSSTPPPTTSSTPPPMDALRWCRNETDVDCCEFQSTVFLQYLKVSFTIDNEAAHDTDYSDCLFCVHSHCARTAGVYGR